MKCFFILLFVLISNTIFGQSQSNCRVDIYLVNKYINCWDSTARKIIPFTVTLNDLEDTAFIKNEEIISYTFRKFRRKGRYRKVMARLHSFETSASLTERIDSLKLSLFGCARQFAIVCNGQVIYGGCLNNHISSWVPANVVLKAREQLGVLSLYPSDGGIDPREDKKLFDCLKNSNRFQYFKKDDDSLH